MLQSQAAAAPPTWQDLEAGYNSFLHPAADPLPSFYIPERAPKGALQRQCVHTLALQGSEAEHKGECS